MGATRRGYNLSANDVFDEERFKALEISAVSYCVSETLATLPNTRGFTLPPISSLSPRKTQLFHVPPSI